MTKTVIQDSVATTVSLIINKSRKKISNSTDRCKGELLKFQDQILILNTVTKKIFHSGIKMSLKVETILEVIQPNFHPDYHASHI